MIYGLSNMPTPTDMEWPSRSFNNCKPFQKWLYRFTAVDKISTAIRHCAVPLFYVFFSPFASCHQIYFSPTFLLFKALNSLQCADVPLRNYSLTHSRGLSARAEPLVPFACWLKACSHIRCALLRGALLRVAIWSTDACFSVMNIHMYKN